MSRVVLAASPAIRAVSHRCLRTRLAKPLAASPDDDRLASLDAVMGVASPTARASPAAPAPSTSTKTMRSCEIELDSETVARVELEVASASSRLIRATTRAPLGIVFEDVAGAITVVEFYDQSPSQGPQSKGIKIGDVLRATSAMVQELSYGKLGILGGGNGRPTWRRVVFKCACGADELDDAAFDQAMKAIGSNAKAGDYDVELVFERRGS